MCLKNVRPRSYFAAASRGARNDVSDARVLESVGFVVLIDVDSEKRALMAWGRKETS